MALCSALLRAARPTVFKGCSSSIASVTSFKDSWNPEQYEKFKLQRLQPFRDLLSSVIASPGMRIVDLGCGTGETTLELHQRLRAAHTLGIDASEAMLQKARTRASLGLGFALKSIENFNEENAYDLVFANASLHFVDDQPMLMERIVRALKPGGQLAVHVPINDDNPSHACAVQTAQQPEFAAALGGHVRVSPVLPAEQYAILLHSLGVSEARVWMQVYLHLLPGRADVVEWVRGSVLTDYEKRMPAELYNRFLDTYKAQLFGTIPEVSPFPYTYKRLFVWARR